MLFKSKKKKRPIEIFKNIKKPHLEEAYVKFPGGKLKRVSEEREARAVSIDYFLIDKLRKKYGSKYMTLHTHHDGDFLPSSADLKKFLILDEVKASVIIPLENESNQPKGYFIMKKNRGYRFSAGDKQYLAETIQPYLEAIKQSDPSVVALRLKDVAKKYNFSYRLIPAEGYRLSDKIQGFRSSRQSLETKLIMASLIFICSSILLSLSNITGNIISESLHNSSNLLGISLFIMGLFFAGLMTYSINKLHIKKIAID